MAKTNDEMVSRPEAAAGEGEASRGTVEAMARNMAARAAERTTSINIDLEAALYQTAQERNLGELKTDEEYFTFGGKEYVLQGFTEGILYAEVGHWDDIRLIPWGTTKDAVEGHKLIGSDQVVGGDPLTGKDVVRGRTGEGSIVS